MESQTNRVLNGVGGDDVGVIAVSESRQDVRGDRYRNAPFHKAVLVLATPQASYPHFRLAVLVLESKTGLHRNNNKTQENRAGEKMGL